MRATIIRRFATPITTPKAASISRGGPAAPSTKPVPESNTRLRTKRREPPLSLEHFLLRSRVLNLYRTILRAIYQIPDKDARREPVAHAKGEFARNKAVRETEQIRYLVSTGKAEWDGMRRYVEELAIRAGG